MTKREWATRYGISRKAVKRIGLGRMEAMSEEGRALLAGMSRHRGPSRTEVKCAMRRIAAEDAILRKDLRRALKREVQIQLLMKEISLRMCGTVHDLVVIRPVKKRCHEDREVVRRMVQLAVKTRAA